MTYFQAVILGIVQGITEFFPVSSSGHLVLVQKLLGIHENVLTFDIFVHFGTLLAVITVFRNSIIKIIQGCSTGLKSCVKDKVPAGRVYRESGEIRLGMGVIIGTFPAVVVGLTLKDFIESLFHSELSVYCALFFTGCVLIGTFYTKKNIRGMGILNGFIVGLAQAVAIIPGISRSGLTISTALFLGVDREEAGEFSFLLAIPVISGATVLAVRDYGNAGFINLHWDVAVLGTVVSFISGWISLSFLIRIIRQGKMGYFGFYCIALAVVGAIISLF